MQTVGTSADAASIIAAQAQQLTNKSRQAQRPQAESAQRYHDSVELRVAGVEAVEGIHGDDQSPDSEGEQSSKREGREDQGGSENPHVDVKA